MSHASAESQPDPRRVEQFAEPSSPAEAEIQALDAAVRATLESADAETRITAEEIAALRAVARRWGDAPLTLEPVAVQLVEAMITVNYGQLCRDAEVWRAAALKIATLLYESPAARARLQNLWRHLIEAKP